MKISAIAYTAVRNKPDSAFYFYRKNKELLDKTDENLTFRNKINLYTLIGNYYRDKEVFDSATVWYNQQTHSLPNMIILTPHGSAHIGVTSI
jgi:hypothetical protein